MSGAPGARSTLILSRSDVAALMQPADYLDAVALGFRALAAGAAVAPPPLEVAGAAGAFHAKAASLRVDRLYVALKLNGNFPDNPERLRLPTIQGAILLCDGETGSVLAIMDSIEVTLRRTAAASALAARHLARPDSSRILVCGCGEQGAAQLEALRAVLPLSSCRTWDRDRRKAERLAAIARSSGLEAEPVGALAPAARASDVIVACTTARAPYLGPQHVAPGAFVAAVGADSPDKSEIEPALMADATVVVDVLAQCLAMGDLRHAVEAGAMSSQAVHAELQQIVSGARPGRTDPDEIVIFDSTGTAVQDVATAAMIYRKAGRDRAVPSVALAG